MIIIKKSNRFIALLLVALTFNTYTMEPEHDYKTIKWVALAGTVVVGGYMAYKQFLSYIHREQPSEFYGLSIEVQYHIIDLLAKVSTATSLQEAAHIINSLAQVNHDLNNLINDPKFCLRIIKSLAKQFDCSDKKAAEALQTKAAKDRLKLQEKLDRLYLVETVERAKIVIKELLQDGVDLFFSIQMMPKVVRWGDIVANSEIHGPAWFDFCFLPHVITVLIENGIDINQQASNGASVVTYLLNRWSQNSVIQALPALFASGADPELADNDGRTPLQIAQGIGNQVIIDLIQDAIDKKHGRK